MLIPYTTDAPIYHRPWGTIGLVVSNVLVFLATGPLPKGDMPPLWLWYGRGLHPVQWLSSNFVHGDFSHLLGNMLFLWVFGLIIEGKTGWRLFLVCYLGIGVVQSMLEQLLMLGYVGPSAGSGGASSAIFGLMAMAAIWAPVNEITFWYVFGWSWMIRTGEFDVGVGLLAALFTGLNVVEAVLGSWSSLLHLGGAVLGAPLAVMLLRAGLVDCEGWDAFSVVRHRRPSHFDDLERTRASLREVAARREKEEATRAARRDDFRRLLDAGDVVGAQGVRRALAEYDGGFPLERADLERLARGLCEAKAWEDAAGVMEEYLRLCPFGSERMQIDLAWIHAAWLDRPRRALEVLEGLDPELLEPDEAARADKIARKARAMLKASAGPG